MTPGNGFQVWAPRAERVQLYLAGSHYPMEKLAEGWWSAARDLPGGVASDAVDYGFLVDDDERPLPDPRSRWQPDGVHGLSRTFDPASYRWGDQHWTGRQLAGAVIYELHIGTFTAEGTLDAAINRLDHLVTLGVDFVELMPVNAFNGSHGWGYDGVAWFAVHEPYGGPEAYQRFVDACHQRGLAVLQDVVYNHLGPSGNYLPKFGPYLREGVSTPWGDPINLDADGSDEVRRLVIDNALMWLREFHVDGLRLDAVHAFVDSRAVHLLEELRTEVDALSAHLGRPLTLIAESDLNDPRMITSRESGGFGLDGQWSDDFHHALVANLTGSDSGYYADFASLDALAKVLERGFFHDGTWSTFRGRRHGRPLDLEHTPTWRLVVCSDNHDQIGNRADGSRLSSMIGTQQLALAALVTLLGPSTPMIFMGEEWGASTPWAFFSSHPEPELATAVSQGRLAEFAKMDWDVGAVPDPQDISTFTGSKLHWSELAEEPHAGLFELNKQLLSLRRQYSEVTDPSFGMVSVDHGTGAEDDRWLLMKRGPAMAVAVNFGAAATTVPCLAQQQPLVAIGEVTVHDDHLALAAHSGAVVRLLTATP